MAETANSRRYLRQTWSDTAGLPARTRIAPWRGSAHCNDRAAPWANSLRICRSSGGHVRRATTVWPRLRLRRRLALVGVLENAAAAGYGVCVRLDPPTPFLMVDATLWIPTPKPCVLSSHHFKRADTIQPLIELHARRFSEVCPYVVMSHVQPQRRKLAYKISFTCFRS